MQRGHNPAVAAAGNAAPQFGQIFPEPVESLIPCPDAQIRFGYGFLMIQGREQSVHFALYQPGIIQRPGDFRLEQLPETVFQPVYRHFEGIGIHSVASRHRRLVPVRGFTSQPGFG